MKSIKVACVAVLTAPLLSGCFLAPLPPAIALMSDMWTGASLVSTVFTGKGTAEHALDAVTGLDCRFDFITKEEREFCEDPNAEITEADFKGISSLVDTIAEGSLDADEEAEIEKMAAAQQPIAVPQKGPTGHAVDVAPAAGTIY